jgi:hypothetical protein
MDSIIDIALRNELRDAGMHPSAIKLAAAALKRDEGALATLGVKQAVAAFKSGNPTLFTISYGDTTKSLEQLERERDQQMRRDHPDWTH